MSHLPLLQTALELAPHLISHAQALLEHLSNIAGQVVQCMPGNSPWYFHQGEHITGIARTISETMHVELPDVTQKLLAVNPQFGDKLPDLVQPGQTMCMPDDWFAATFNQWGTTGSAMTLPPTPTPMAIFSEPTADIMQGFSDTFSSESLGTPTALPPSTGGEFKPSFWGIAGVGGALIGICTVAYYAVRRRLAGSGGFKIHYEGMPDIRKK